jgi:hypothetical protein
MGFFWTVSLVGEGKSSRTDQGCSAGLKSAWQKYKKKKEKGGKERGVKDGLKARVHGEKVQGLATFYASPHQPPLGRRAFCQPQDTDLVEESPQLWELTGAVLDSNANTRSAPTQRAKWLL